MREFGTPITLDEMEALGLRAISALPHAFREQLGDVVFAVEDFADDIDEMCDQAGVPRRTGEPSTD